jgi:integrase
MTTYAERFAAWDAVAPLSKQLHFNYVTRFERDFDPMVADTGAISMWVHRDSWASNTQVTAYATLKKFYYWLTEIVEERSDNPMLKVPKPRPKRGEPRPVPEATLKQVLADVSDPEVALMVRLAALQGMRRSEIAGLRVADIDLSSDVIYVRGKGNKMRRIPLHPEVRPWLTGLTGVYVFPSKRDDGRHVTPTTVGRKVSAALGKRFSTHQLRHRFASAVYEASNHDLRLVQELLGHASVATTQIYTAVSSESMREAVAGV